MKKLVFGITSLTLGGAERVLVDIANKLKDDYEISIFTIYSGGEFEKVLNSKIKLESIYNRPFNSMNWFKRKLAVLKILLFKSGIYKKYISGKYDIEIAFLEGPVTRLFSVRKNKVKKIAWIHNDISRVYGNSLASKVKKVMDQKAYSAYDNLVFVSKDNLDVFENEYKKLDKTKKQVIYNYIDSVNVIKKAKDQIEALSNETNIVTVTRLVEQKAIDRLIKVHKKLLDDGVNHRIYVIGEGPQRQKLEKQINDYKVENTFILLGKKENPYPYIKIADCFVLFSYYEGYGMVIEEAKILDKFIMITDTAAREALKGYKESKITENTEEGIYNAIKDFVLNKEKYFRQNEESIVKYNNEELLEEIKNLMGD